jgi:2,3-bisphosphoglycerate-independent phosphoglycerate mutase
MLSRFSLKESKIVTLMGRFFAMDRDNRLERTHLAYETMLLGKSEYHFASFEDAISFFYTKGITDEFIPPCIIDYEQTPLMKDGDSLMMINFRADRAKQIMRCFLGEETQTSSPPPKFEHIIGMSSYDPSFTEKMDALFEKQHPKDSLGEIVARHGYAQLRIAETEKYAHVTFFFSGQEAPFDKEDRILIPSQKVKTYDLLPEMSAFTITETLLPIIKKNQHALIVVNYANADMVGHSGNFDATCEAIQTIDACIQKIYNVCQQTQTTLVITADHGNAECMYDKAHHCIHTAHTCSKVPLIIIPGHLETMVSLPQNGGLADIKNIVLQQMQL